MHSALDKMICQCINVNVMEMHLQALLTHSQLKVIKGVLVDDVKLPHQSKCELNHCSDVHVLPVMVLWNKEQNIEIGELILQKCTN